ncbi:hypothetical protein QFC24_004237 [Naganishia onofrii]|uniref:Uncharacterized protein n=1 Tax=Naganishia onofrii TaxID=1851511 RepID=A0ACC2XHC9_9TREE|nr:hypothetical protein QFC24_004237 [Naganishia onofrii]
MEGSDVNSCIDSPILEPSGPAPRIKASRRRWTDSVSASRSTDAQASSQRMSVATGTPVSKGTPETLRTLELNWRDRRRAKLEDITLQRVMGVEKRGKLQEEITSGVARKHTGLQTQPLDARTTKDRPLRDIEASSQAGKETAILRSEAVSNGLKPTDNVSRPRDGHKIPLTGITTAATTTNNTTYQTGANKARKIVKLVRDARLSVQASEEQVSARVPADAKDHASAGHLSKAQGIPVKRTLDLPLKSVPARLPSATTSTKPPPVIAQRTSATPRRVSILREAPSQQKNGSAHCYSQPSTGSRFPRSSVLTSRNIDALYPITVSPLPAQEYPLSSTATLIVYPYEQDWSVDLPSQAASPEGQSGSSRRRQPVMSALTASERIDILDEGKTMRIKSTSKHSSAKTKPSRFLRLKERDSWREVDQRRWTLLQLLVDRLKRRTRRVCLTPLRFVETHDV